MKGTQYSLPSHVVKLAPIRPVDLAARMNVDPSTLSRNLQPLIAVGCWLAVEAWIDACSRPAHATEAGRAKRHEAQEGTDATLCPSGWWRCTR